MGHIFAARVADTSLTTGSEPSIVVSGIPEIGMRTFSSVMNLGDTCYIGVANRGKNEWEEGMWRYTAINRLTRVEIYESSNNGGAVNYSAGIKDVWITHLARAGMMVEASLNYAGKTVVDFGAWPGQADTSVTIAAAVTTNSIVQAALLAADTADHTADEHWSDPIEIVAGSVTDGSFTIYATSHQAGFTPYGKYSVSWWWK